MCQLPLISMWVSRIKSPEKRMTIHLPADSTPSTVRPATGVSSFTRASFTSTVSQRVTTRPPIARCSVRAARQIVSPSGTLFLVGLGVRFHFHYRRHTTHLEPHRRRDKAGVFEESRQEMLARGKPIDLADQQPGPSTLPAHRDLCEFARDFARYLRPLGFVLRQRDADRRIATPQKCREPPVHQHHTRAARPRHAMRTGMCLAA